MFNTPLHGQIIPTMLGARRLPCTCWIHNYSGDILARFQSGLFSLQTRRPLWFHFMSGSSRSTTAHKHSLLTALRQQLQVLVESNTQTVFTGSGVAALCVNPAEQMLGKGPSVLLFPSFLQKYTVPSILILPPLLLRQSQIIVQTFWRI